jgi:hypothetical protein
MARGNEIIVSANPKGHFLEGIVSGTPKPGTCMEQYSTALSGGVFTWRVYTPGTDGEQRLVAVLLPDSLQGQLATTAYVSGDRCFMYCPIPGEELNMLKLDESGTADDIAIGSVLTVDSSTGKLILTTGSPEMEPFIACEAVTDPTADQLVWCRYTGK